MTDRIVVDRLFKRKPRWMPKVYVENLRGTGDRALKKCPMHRMKQLKTDRNPNAAAPARGSGRKLCTQNCPRSRIKPRYPQGIPRT